MNYICRLIYFFANQVPCVESHDPIGHERGEGGRDDDDIYLIPNYLNKD